MSCFKKVPKSQWNQIVLNTKDFSRVIRGRAGKEYIAKCHQLYFQVAYGLHPGWHVIEQIRASSAPLWVYYVVWYIKLLLEVYETVNWSEMGKAIP